MPFSIQHLRETNKFIQRKRRAKIPCPCNVCNGKRWISYAVIKRHEESFGRSKQLSDYDDEPDELQPTSAKNTKQNDSTSTSIHLDFSSSADEGENGTTTRTLKEEIHINANSASSCHDHDEVGYQESTDEPNTVENDSEIGSSKGTYSSIDNINDSDISHSAWDDSASTSESDDHEDTENSRTDIYASEKALLPLFEGSSVTVLQVLAGFFAWFTEHPSTSKSALNDLLILNKNILPVPNNLPRTYEEAYQFVKPFLLTSKVYHVCKNDCIIYRKTGRYDYSKLKTCPVCGSPRYFSGGTQPVRTFHYYPLGPRWKRMYGNARISEILQKHANRKGNSDSSIMTDVQDSPAWKAAFDTKGFSMGDQRGVALQLSTDGVNPFSSNKVVHSMWLIMLSMLNLHKRVRNLFGNFMLAGIIPAQAGGSEPLSLDPYLEVVVDELLELSGVPFHDSLAGSSFEFKVTILNYVLDFPGLGKTFHAASPTALQACMWCDLRGISIPSLDKVVFLGNRRFLPSNHELRKNRRNFPWNQKEESPTPEQTISEDLLWDAVTHSKAPNKTQAANITKATGSKGVNCFMLLPDHDRPKQAFPDMMHTLRNVVVSFFDLITGRGDAVKVRNGEKEVNRFKECWVNGNDSNTGKALPPAPFVLSRKNIKIADERAKGIYVPTGYGWKPFPIFSKKTYLKCHDWKQLAVDGILKYCLRGLLGEQQRNTFFELLDVLSKMCSDVQDYKELQSLQMDTNLVLAKVERDFPVSIQNISLHILHHIIDGIKLYGPVHSWWMFSQERFNSWICQRVKNRRYPEATIMTTYKIFDWVQFMRLSGQLQLLNTGNSGEGNSEHLTCMKNDVYQLSQQERETVQQLTASKLPSNMTAKRYFSLRCECQRTGKEILYKAEKLSFSDSVVILNTNRHLPKVGVVKHFISLVGLDTSCFITLKVFRTTQFDKDSGLLFVSTSNFDEQTVYPRNISGPCVTAVDSQPNILWVINAHRGNLIM